MNVLIVSEPGLNGVFRFVEALCDYLLAHNVRVHLAYSDVRSSDRLALLVNRITAAGGKTVNLRVDSYPAPGDLRALWQLRKFARQVRPDVIHSHSSKAGALARALVFLGIRCPQLYHPHAYRGMQPEAGKFMAVFNLAESLLGLVGSTINCSADERAFALNRLRIAEGRSFLIPNGIDCRRFQPVDRERKNALRRQFDLPLDVPVLGTVCRCSVQKDPFTLYQAFALALRTCPDAWLFHVGDGELDAEVELLIDRLGVRSRVVRRPYLQNTAEAYQAVDGFILTTRYEGFSLAALEAMATNLPIVISEAPGTNDVIRLPLSHLWKSQPGDAAGFATSIELWYQAVRRPAPANHAEIARELYDSRVSLQRVHELYRAQVQAAGEARPARRPEPFAAEASFTISPFLSRSLLAVGALGIFAALILTLKPSGDVPYTPLTPDWLTHWINRHGVLRNLFAYALLAVPFLFREPRFNGRVQVVWRLAVFATAVECAQLFIPTRWFELADIGMSLLGIASTWVMIEGFWRGARHYHSPIRRLQQHLAIRWRSFTGASKRAL